MYTYTHIHAHCPSARYTFPYRPLHTHNNTNKQNTQLFLVTPLFALLGARAPKATLASLGVLSLAAILYAWIQVRVECFVFVSVSLYVCVVGSKKPFWGGGMGRGVRMLPFPSCPLCSMNQPTHRNCTPTGVPAGVDHRPARPEHVFPGLLHQALVSYRIHAMVNSMLCRALVSSSQTMVNYMLCQALVSFYCVVWGWL
jgi:hypothetical protein